MNTQAIEGKTLKFEGVVAYKQIRNLRNRVEIQRLDLSNCIIEVGVTDNKNLVLPAFEEVDLSNTILEIRARRCDLTYVSIESKCKRLNITNFKIQSSTMGWIEISNFFSDCKNLEEVTGFPSFLKLNKKIFTEDTDELFAYCRSLKSIDFGDDYTWDINTSYLNWFKECENLKYINLGNIGEAPKKAKVAGLFCGLSPDVTIKHKGKFRSDIIYSESGYYIISHENLPNQTNLFKYLFESPKDTELIINIARGLMIKKPLSKEEINKIPVIHCKTPKELKAYKLKQELLGTKYFDLVGGIVYLSDSNDIILLLQEDY